MRKLLFLLFILSACTHQPDKRRKAAQEIIDADRAMNLQASKEGFNKTLLLYADDSVIKPNEGKFPIIGKQSLINAWAGKEDTKAITWEPTRVEAARSGDIGYTFGNWKMVTKDSSYFGNYYTIWKRQSDGAWKYVVDGGNNTPQPK